MFNNRVKYFGDFGELSSEERLRFLDFEKLNRIIEGSNLSKEDVEESYVDVLLKQEKEIEIDIEVKQLLDNVKVACNKILTFIDFKFPTYKKAILSYSQKFSFLDYDIVKQIIDSNESIFTLIIGKCGLDEERIQMQFSKGREDEFLELIKFLLNKYNNGYIINLKLDKVLY